MLIYSLDELTSRTGTAGFLISAPIEFLKLFFQTPCTTNLFEAIHFYKVDYLMKQYIRESSLKYYTHKLFSYIRI